MEEHSSETDGRWFYKWYAIFVSDLEITVETYCNLCNLLDYRTKDYYFISNFMESVKPKLRRSTRLSQKWIHYYV